MLSSGRTGRQNGILRRKDAAGHQVWTHFSWVRLMEPSLITQKTSSPPHPVTRLQSVGPGKVCRGNPEFSWASTTYKPGLELGEGRGANVSFEAVLGKTRCTEF